MFKLKLFTIFLWIAAFCYNISYTSDYDHVYQLAHQTMISRALYVAADLQLADHLQNSLSLQDLAHAVGVDAVALQRLLRCLVEHGVFSFDENDRVCNNARSLLLSKNHPQTIRPFILHDDPTRWNAIGNLGYSVKTGKASFDELYDTDYFSYLKNDSALSERFDEAMTIISEQEDKRIAHMINFSGIVADIGGGKGQLLQHIAANNSEVTQLILFDLQQVHDNVLSQKTQMTHVAGSFFDPIAITADVFILKRILHDWDDEKALLILRNVAAAMNAENVLYIVDAVIDQCENKKLILDIDLRLLSIFGGKERMRAEFESLCVAAGLEIIEIRELTSISHVIQCRKIG